jgi:hypothetical protein
MFARARVLISFSEKGPHMSHAHRSLVLGLVAGSVVSCASLAHAQGVFQPQCFFWEPPASPGPIHPKFCPIARVKINDPDATASFLASNNTPFTSANLPAGLSANTYSVRALRDYYTSQGWLTTGELSVFLQDAKTTAHKPSSLLGIDEVG